MKNKKLIFSVLFTGILFLNTFLFTNINENRLQLNSLFTLATAQSESLEEIWASGICHAYYELLDEYEGYYNNRPGTYYEIYYNCQGNPGYCSISGARTKFYYDLTQGGSTLWFSIVCDETAPSNC